MPYIIQIKSKKNVPIYNAYNDRPSAVIVVSIIIGFRGKAQTNKQKIIVNTINILLILFLNNPYIYCENVAIHKRIVKKYTFDNIVTNKLFLE